MKNIFNKFWKWYENHPVFNTGVASALFTLQLVHLYWLTTDVVLVKLTEKSLFNHGLPANLFSFTILIVDYLEIPAIVTTTLIYINELRKTFNWRSVLFLLIINSQFLHIFWITDEFVFEHLFKHSGPSILPVWLAWVAILIDYLELPVIYDTIKKFYFSLKKVGLKPAFEDSKN